MAISLALPWSPGERAVQSLMHTPPDTDNPTSSFMTPQAATMLARAPTIALGALDADGRPWATVWGGEPGFAQPLGNGIFGVRAPVDRRFDPVAQALVDGKAEGEVVKEEGRAGRMVAGLPIDLVTRKRVKVFGRMVVASLAKGGGGVGDEKDGGEVGDADDVDGAGEMQLVVKVEQSLGNCPKYLNSKAITPATPHPVLLSSSPTLTPTARALIAKADLFFISSANATTHDMDVNHRGGPAGFVRILPCSDPSSPTTLVYPEYSGNRFYQTLGNLHTTPLAGLCFPDFATGDVLYATGTTSIHAGKAAAALLPRSTLAVAITLTAARLVRRGLPFRGTPAAAGAGNAAAAAAAAVKTGTDEEKEKTLGMSPYNPPVRLLAAEGSLLSSGKEAQTELTATLGRRDAITPATIARFTFALSAPTAVARGQWVALDASKELDAGYSHMRDDDPASLNDDFVRTFTVTWADGWEGGDGDGDVVRPSTEFAITIRRHGPVTGLLFTSSPERAGLALPVRGFGGGEFRVRAAAGLTPFVAGGVGITPLLAELAASSLDPARVALFWTLRRADAAFVGDVFRRWPGLARGARVFLTTRGGGGGDVDGVVEGLREQAATGALAAVVEGRRLEEEDLREVESERWYLCAGTALHKQVVAWLAGRGEVVSESFNF
ncbi:hypothetical protein SLS58_001605 [Diplodia intermedia]|uniref:FAD-binding FR-type domain-containing protein n=1 Tax=Diplodia intermedia TaxID=856260 RepID=A0ABR3U1K7_9PEZI